MGAGAAVAGSAGSFAGCVRKPVEHIYPFSKRPEDLIPGKALYFATAIHTGGAVHGLLVESQDGRPTKVEGNPRHPNSLGSANSWAQSAVSTLYDASRSCGPKREGKKATWDEINGVVSSLAERLDGTDGAGLAMLLPSMPSPTFQHLLSELRRRHPAMGVYRHDLAGRDQARQGAALVGAGGLVPRVSLANADVILAIDSDILLTEDEGVRQAREFAHGRRANSPDDPINRLYAVETALSLTGTMADHRLRLPSSRIGSFLVHVIHGLSAHGVALPEGATLPDAPSPSAGPWPVDEKRTALWMDAVAEDLASQRGRSVILVGERQPAYVHALAHLANTALGNIGKTVAYHVDVDTPGVKGLDELATAIAHGQVDRLVCMGGNPAYDAPGNLGFEVLVGQVPLSVHLSPCFDETSRVSTWHIPEAHAFESWGDLSCADHTCSIQQPLIAPLHEAAVTPIELLARLLGDDESSSYDLIRARWKSQLGGARAETMLRSHQAQESLAAAQQAVHDAQATSKAAAEAAAEDKGKGKGKAVAAAAAAAATATKTLAAAEIEAKAAKKALDAETSTATPRFDRDWKRWLHDGVIDGTAAAPTTPTFDWSGVKGAYQAAESARATTPAPTPGGVWAQDDGKPLTFEIGFALDPSVIDGRLANCGWMQELPDAVTKLTWDNAALMSKATAAAIGVATGDMVQISYQQRRLLAPAMTIMGVADGSIVLPVGYGRRAGGRVAYGVGFDANAIRTSGSPWLGGEGHVAPVPGFGPDSAPRTYQLATTQTMLSLTIEGKRRPLVRVADHAEFAANPRFVLDDEPIPEEAIRSLWDEPNATDGHQWGMSIDLNACNGCNACTVACQAENNISVVGKERVAMGREMHWIRVDRYFDGNDDEPLAVTQPIPCLQCETAPCEQVCPVGATAHSPDGLNDMAYNRCIGTRYCANNCPAKVRRFNYFNYAKENDQLLGNLSFMQRNPDVTVRFRGVIEKCTYCVQRINEAKITAKREGHGVVPDGAIVPACAQTCPTEAIVFGDINDGASRVSVAKKRSREYAMFNDMNLKPRTTYAGRIRNPNPKLSKLA